ncbi:hypothetical protein DMB95_08335 [Campylobacter sp. MIT 12-8780]|uniref:response regulator n=1 Tax=unclassified Campylobacter TaxID=2593542 RepID=UPI00115F5657|nr:MULTISPECIES: response regulator [unclassified Campylobacter]NDJ27396.1 response regulator [Campylobacter sp. MIT 19-121]TQR40213.1 hypothetical protein DMB95_08335 [Campylobacter sp. MIT 12-8780]
MKVLIVENELYLAQSISNKLSDIGYICDIVAQIKQVDTNAHYDVILLSTNIDEFEKIITHFKQSVIVLLISYISVDTVISPLKAGASDYIQKPFMIEELIRKIKHHQEYKALQLLNKSFLTYIQTHLKKAKIKSFDYKKLQLPLILKTFKQVNADAFVFHYLKTHQLKFSCIDLSEVSGVDKILKHANDKNLLFLVNFQSLKADEKEKLLAECKNKKVIIYTNSELDLDTSIHTIDLNDGEKSLANNEILTIDEYVKFIITQYQNTFPDTDLSKRLGISRKSLWEKRKKYGLAKKK